MHSNRLPKSEIHRERAEKSRLGESCDDRLFAHVVYAAAIENWGDIWGQSWEVYGPDNRVRPSIFPEYGSIYSLKLEQFVPFALEHPIPEHLREREREDGNAPVTGSYTIRAAFTDVFGPPAIAYQTIFPQE